MRNILVICKDYASIKKEISIFNAYDKKYCGIAKINVTQKFVELGDNRFVFVTKDEKEKKVMGLFLSGFWVVGEPLPSDLMALIYTRIR
jgi:hypothetical protein